jgi:hypothetical protein
LGYLGAYIEVSLASGNYCEFSCPQLINPSGIDVSEFLPFLGTDSGSTEAEITACQLKVTHDMAADSVAFSSTSSERDGVLLISGYCQPMFSSDYVGVSGLNTIVEAVGYDTSIKLNLGYDGSTGLEWALYYGGTERATAAILNHRLGDIYAFGFWSGYADGTANTQFRAVRLRDEAAYGSSYVGSMITCKDLYIGSANGGSISDCVMSCVSVSSQNNDYCVNAVNRLVDETIRNVARSTAGRWYKLSRGTNPKRYMPSANEGTITGTEVRAI